MMPIKINYQSTSHYFKRAFWHVYGRCNLKSAVKICLSTRLKHSKNSQMDTVLPFHPYATIIYCTKIIMIRWLVCVVRNLVFRSRQPFIIISILRIKVFLQASQYVCITYYIQSSGVLKKTIKLL